MFTQRGPNVEMVDLIKETVMSKVKKGLHETNEKLEHTTTKFEKISESIEESKDILLYQNK